MQASRLPVEYFHNENTLFLGRDLLGKYLLTYIDGQITGGMITETESYLGSQDKSCHAYGYRKTARNEAMYSAGGIAYVYLCYGIHSLFNIVTHREGEPHAILIRALKPEIGIESIQRRRSHQTNFKKLMNGPGSLTEGLGISTLHNKTPLLGPLIWLEDRGIKFKENEIETTPRIGIDYAEEDALKPWRFVAHWH